MKKESFLKGAALLGVAGIIVKIFGAFFRIILARIIGSEGMGYFQVGYPVYTLLLSFSSMGFPVAISKLVSERRVQGEAGAAHKIFKTSLRIMMIMGAITAVLMAVGARFVAENLVKSPYSYYSLLVMAPGLFFVPILAAYRGYFQGMKNMTPTAVSQIVEQMGRAAIGILLAMLLLGKGMPLAAAGASFGATAGGLMGFLYIYYLYRRHQEQILSQFDRLPDEHELPTRVIFKDLLTIAVPIIIGGAVMPLINIVDTMIVLRRLQAIGFSYEEANQLFGQLTGMATTLINLPQVITVALSVSIVPVISESAVRNNQIGIQRDARSAFRISLLIGLPAAAGLAVLSGPIMQLLFPREPASAGEVLLFLSMGVFFLTQVQTLTGILQGVGKQTIPVRNLLIGGLVKILTTYTLTGIPSLNVKGAALGTVSAYLVASVLNLRAVVRHTGTTFPLVQFFVKPLVSVLIMAGVVKVSYDLFFKLFGNNLATLLAIGIGVAIYGLALLITRTLTKEDVRLIRSIRG